MDQVTTGAVPNDEELTRFGYRQQFARSLRHFESFAVAFSFISITTGIFTTYAFALATGGTRSIWTWPIVIAGQSLVALVYGALSVTASTIMPALLYAGTVLLYIFTARGRGSRGSQGTQARPFGKYELPIVAGAVIWLAYELIILIGPSEFRDAQYYVLGALGVGLVFYIVQLVTEREAMRKEPGQR
jgi:hypothetical protein